MLSDCKAPRNVCECASDTLAETWTYEEVIQASRKRAGQQAAVDIQAKAGRNLNFAVPVNWLDTMRTR